jgi:hypothetical protein
VSPQCRNWITQAQCHCCISLCVRKVDVGDGQAAEERLRKWVFRVRIEDHLPGVSDGNVGGPLRESRDLSSSRSSMIRLCSSLISAPSPSMGLSKMLTSNASSAARTIRLLTFF